MFPSTIESSAVVVGVLATSVAGCWWGSRGADEEEVFPEGEEGRKKERGKKLA